MILFENELDNSDVVPYVKCPSCRQLFKLEVAGSKALTNAQNCPACAVPIGEIEIKKSYETYVWITRAVESAYQVIDTNYGLIFILGFVLVGMCLVYLIEPKALCLIHVASAFSLLYLTLGLIRIQKWLDKFGYRLVDEEIFNVAKRRIKRSRILWVSLIVINLFLWLIYIKFF